MTILDYGAILAVTILTIGLVMAGCGIGPFKPVK